MARLGQARLRLERVLLAPVGVQPLKGGEAASASWEQRLRMVELAVAGVAGLGARGLEASAVDAPRPDRRPNYSVETLARVAEQNAGAQIFFLMGVDAFAGLRRWRDAVGLLELCDLAVASRPGMELPSDGNALLAWMPEGTRFLGTEEMAGTDKERAQVGADGAAGCTAVVFLVGSALVRVALLEDLAEDVAATELRAELARGAGFEWLPGGAEGAVAAYVREHGLYGLEQH